MAHFSFYRKSRIMKPIKVLKKDITKTIPRKQNKPISTEPIIHLIFYCTLQAQE